MTSDEGEVVMLRCSYDGCTTSLCRRILCAIVGGMLSLLPLASFSQTSTCGVTWDAPIRISTDSIPSLSPRISVTGDTIHVFWFGLDTLGTVGEDGIQYSHSFDGGRTFATPRSLVSMDTAFPPVFIASAGQFVYAVFPASIDTFYGSVLIRSIDAGISWGPVTLLGNGLQPVCIAATNSTVYVQLIDPRANPILYRSARSSDYGATWTTSISPALQAVVPGSNYFHGLSVQVEDRSNEVGYYVSENLGASWFGPEFLSRVDPTPSVLPSLAANEKENLFAIWNDNGTILMRRSKDRGSSWSPQVQISGAGNALLSDITASHEFVSIAWDNTIAHGIHFRGSNDFADTFCGVDSLFSGTHAGEPAMAISNNHLHLVCWEEVGGVDREIVYRRGDLTENPDLPTAIPKSFALHQNYPNPFNGSTVIEYDIPHGSPVTLVLYNVLGQRVATLVDAFQPAFRYKIPFEGSDMPTGVYFYRLKTDSFTETKKLLIVR